MDACWRPGSALAAVLIGLLLGLGAGVALVVTSDADAIRALGLVVGDLVLLACVVAMAARETGHLGAATFGIRRAEWGPAIGWGAAVLVAVFGVNGLLALVIGTGGDGSSSTVHFSPAAALLVALGVAVTAPLAEETAFRGYLFPALTRWRGPWIAAAVTAVLFGVAHFAALPIALLPGVAFFGFGMCLLFWFTGSLLPGVAVHSLNNAIALTVVTSGQLAWAIPAAPLVSLLVLMPLARERAPAAEAAV